MEIQSGTRRSITAVVVLYNRTLSQSSSFSTLSQVFNTNPEIARHFSLVVYDNSPPRDMREVSADFPISFHYDPSNGGLAAAYNCALAHAEQTNDEWLLLLDQDTSLTYEFFSELVASATALQSQQDVAAIVPKLMARGEIHSPQKHFIDKLRRPFSRHSSGPAVTGVQAKRLLAFNSGTTLRVSALQRVGGFPNEFWLDYLDHAIFHVLYASGYRTNVMTAVLDHGFSESDLNSVPLWRFRNALNAQTLFVKRVGTFADQQLYRLWLLRYSRKLWACCDDRRRWKEAVVQSIRLRVSQAPDHNQALGSPFVTG